MHSFLEKFENGANSLVITAFLIASIVGVADFFGAGTLPPWMTGPMNVALPWVLAVAFESLGYLLVRQLKKLRHNLRAPALEVHVRKAYEREATATLVVLVGLQLFAFWNQLNYLMETWQPHTNNIFLVPVLVLFIVRALAIPAFFMAAAFLAPLPESAGAQVERESREAMAQVLKVLRDQRKAALEYATKHNVDLTGLVEAVSEAAGERKAGALLAKVQSAVVGVVNGSESAPPAPYAGKITGTKASDLTRKHWRPGMSAATLAKLAGVHENTARRHIKEFENTVPLRLAK